MWYQREFPKFDENLHYVYEGLQVPETWDYRTQGEAFQRWIDCSWHNDSCPRFSYAIGSPYDVDMNLDLFVDFVDPAMSDNPESRADGSFKRFNLYIEQACKVIKETDDWLEMKAFIEGYTAALKTACIALTYNDDETIKNVGLLYKPLRGPMPTYYKVHNPRTYAAMEKAVDIFLGP